MNLVFSPQGVPTPSYTFQQKIGRSGKGSFTDKAKIVDRGSKSSAPECTGAKLQYEPFPSMQCVPEPGYPFREKFGDQGKCRSQKKLKSLIEVPNVVHEKVHVPSFNMILTSSPQRVLTPSFPLWGKFGKSGKGSYTEKADILVRGSLCSPHASTGSKLQYEPDHFSVQCSQTKLSVSV